MWGDAWGEPWAIWSPFASIPTPPTPTLVGGEVVDVAFRSALVDLEARPAVVVVAARNTIVEVT